jgi:hypothetical protein
MSFLLENQLVLILSAFAAGIAGWLTILGRPAASRAWKLADLVWVVLGGFGAVAAIMAGLYRADTGRIERQIDLAFASSRAFDRDAARFRLTWCAAPEGPVAVLCDKADYLSASTALNRDLPLFLDITRHAAPLQRLRLFGAPPGTGGMAAMAGQADQFDMAEIVAFQARDPGTNGAIEALRADGRAGVAAEFQVLAQAYEELIADVQLLKQEWDYLRANAIYLKIQVFALCLVAFAAPFRLGKSLADLR